ncbi:hypothetical protein DFH09DRAFT_1277251 [Mycena vulgaris]|nr:hypothetical protein DFH09DRAFT_1277251 [Mycena vulgaris]
MSQSQSTVAPLSTPAAGFLPFESPCGCRGCPEIFKYEGTDPFGGLEALVTAHKQHCVGRNLGCDTGWQPSKEMTQQWHWQQPHGGAAETYRGQNVDTDQEDVDWKASQTRLMFRTPDESGDGNARASDDEMPIRSHSDAPGPPCRKQKRGGNKHRVPPKTPLGPNEVHIKKTSNSEAHRKAALENDQWTLVVEPASVVCRGCKQAIALDKRSRYYPGLWDKHRDRCDGVKKERALLEQAHEVGRQSPSAEAVDELKPLQGSRCPLQDGQEATVGLRGARMSSTHIDPADSEYFE